MRKFIILSLALLLAGCASPDYQAYAKAQAAADTAKHQADTAKYKAMSDIAATGDATAKVAAVMAMAMGQTNATTNSTLQAPRASEALQWASILVPGLTQVAGMRYNYLSQQTQSNNATALGISTNSTFAGIAGKIQAPGAVSTVTTTTTDNHTQTLSGTGTLGSGAYTTTDSHAQTLSGAGTMGSGSYSTPAPLVITPVINPPVVINPPIQITPIQIVPIANPNPSNQITPTVNPNTSFVTGP